MLVPEESKRANWWCVKRSVCLERASQCRYRHSLCSMTRSDCRRLGGSLHQKSPWSIYGGGLACWVGRPIGIERGPMPSGRIGWLRRIVQRSAQLELSSGGLSQCVAMLHRAIINSPFSAKVQPELLSNTKFLFFPPLIPTQLPFSSTRSPLHLLSLVDCCWPQKILTWRLPG